MIQTVPTLPYYLNMKYILVLVFKNKDGGSESRSAKERKGSLTTSAPSSQGEEVRGLSLSELSFIYLFIYLFLTNIVDLFTR